MNNRDEELDRFRQETLRLQQALAVKDMQMGWLEQENQSLREALTDTAHIIKHLRDRVQALEEQQAKDSHNSHLPPSSNRFGKHKQKSLRKPSGKKPGGQPGHQGHGLQPMAQPDEVLIHRVDECQYCHQSLELLPVSMAERRQVIDFPEKRLWITEHQIEEKRCPVCLRTSRAAFPETVKAKAQYGPHLQALGVYLVQSQLLPYGRASQLLREVLGLQISAGSLVQWVRTCAASLGEVETRIKESLKKARVIHQDETGLRAKAAPVLGACLFN